MNKRPCEQCRRTQEWEYSKKRFAGVETPNKRVWASCCGEWIYSYDKKLAWVRP